VKVGTLIKGKYDDNIYVIVGEEACYKESSYPFLKTVKLWDFKRNIFVYPVRRIVESDYEILST
jgi:hypothetical protein